MQPNTVDFRLTSGSWAGLCLVTAFGVGLFCAAMYAAHPEPTRQSGFFQGDCDGYCMPCDCSQNPGFNGNLISSPVQKLPQPIETAPPVNTAARDEVKQQAGYCPDGTCPNVRPQQLPAWAPANTYTHHSVGQAEAQAEANRHGANLVTVRMLQTNQIQCYGSLPNGRLWKSTGNYRTKTYAGGNCFVALLQDMQQGSYPATPAVNPVVNPATPAITPQPQPIPQTAEQGKLELTLFVDNSPRSQMLLSWFESNAGLAAAKTRTSFEVLTATNALYQTRYANVISTNQFPAVLCTLPGGGHCYAAGGNMLPGTANELLSDLRKGYEYATQVRQAPVLAEAASGLLRETGYSWDASITQGMYLNQISQDCPDGSCPDGNCPDVTPQWRPGDRLRDGGLFGPDPAEAILWAGGDELVKVVLVGLVVVLVIFYAIKSRS